MKVSVFQQNSRELLSPGRGNILSSMQHSQLISSPSSMLGSPSFSPQQTRVDFPRNLLGDVPMKKSMFSPRPNRQEESRIRQLNSEDIINWVSGNTSSIQFDDIMKKIEPSSCVSPSQFQNGCSPRDTQLLRMKSQAMQNSAANALANRVPSLSSIGGDSTDNSSDKGNSMFSFRSSMQMRPRMVTEYGDEEESSGGKEINTSYQSGRRARKNLNTQNIIKHLFSSDTSITKSDITIKPQSNNDLQDQISSSRQEASTASSSSVSSPQLGRPSPMKKFQQIGSIYNEFMSHHNNNETLPKIEKNRLSITLMTSEPSIKGKRSANKTNQTTAVDYFQEEEEEKEPGELLPMIRGKSNPLETSRTSNLKTPSQLPFSPMLKPSLYKSILKSSSSPHNLNESLLSLEKKDSMTSPRIFFRESYYVPVTRRRSPSAKRVQFNDETQSTN